MTRPCSSIRHLPRAACLLAAFSTLPLASCGQTAKPSPTDAALNAPEGSTPQAPREPAPLLPPPIAADPGRIIRPFR